MAAKIKINAVSKDLDIKSKDVIALLEKFEGKAKSSVSALEPNELDIIFEYFTQLHSVESFKFLEEKAAQRAAKPEKAAPEKKEEQPDDDMSIKVERTARYVDTRNDTVDLEKFDTEMIEELVSEDILETSTKKQKIKKGKNKVEKNVENHDKKPEKKEKKEPSVIQVPDEISVGEFAKRMDVPAAEVVKKLMLIGVMASVSQNIDFDTAELISTEFNFIVEKEIIVIKEVL